MHINEAAEYALLGLLESEPQHGYELYQQFQGGTLGQIIHLEMSQMYAYLKKLERLTYIEAQIEQQGIRPPRKVYHLTEAGRSIFLQWLTAPVERPREMRILFLIKLYFVQRLAPEQTPQLVEKQVVACQNFLTHLEALHSEDAPPHAEDADAAFFDHVVLRSRIHHTRALLDWLRELQQHF